MANFAPVMTEIKALEAQVLSLQKAMVAANGTQIMNTGIARGISNLSQTRQVWDYELKQSDKLTQALQKRKITMQEMFDINKNMNKMIDSQIRLQNAQYKELPGGASMMTIPGKQGLSEMTTGFSRGRMEAAMFGQALNSLGTSVVDWGKNTQWAGRQLMVGFMVPFAAAAAAAGVYAYQIDKAMVQIEKVYNGSTVGLRDMATETARVISTGMGGAVKDSLAVMAQLAAIGKEGSELQEATTETMRLSVLGDMDKETSLKAVVAMQATFQMSSKELANTINYMNQIENETSLSMNDFAEAIPRAAGPIANLGGSMRDLSLLMVAMKERGVDAGEGANAIKTLMTRMLNPTKQMNAQFKEMTGGNLPDIVKQANGQLIPTIQAIQKAMDNANLSAFEQQQVISRLGGAYQATRLTAIFQGMKGDSEQMKNALKVTQMSSQELFLSAYNETAKIVNSASGQFTRAVESFKLQWVEFGETALTVATWVIEKVTKMAEVFNSMPAFVKNSVVAVAAFAASLSVILMTVGLFGNLFGNIMKGVGAVGRWIGGYKALTVEQKQQELQMGKLGSKYLTQSDQIQVLIYQLDKLKVAYQATNQMAAQSMAQQMAPGAAGAGRPAAAILGNGTPIRQFTNAKGESTYRAVDPNTGKFSRNLNPAELSEANSLLAVQKQATADIADNVEKSSRFQRIMNGQGLAMVGTATMLAGSFMDMDGALGKIVTTGGLVLTLLGMFGPYIGTAATAIKTKMIDAMAAAAIYSGVLKEKMGLAGKAVGDGTVEGTSRASRAISGLSGAVRGVGRGIAAAASFAFGPWGVAIAALGVGLFALYSYVKSDEQAAINRQKELSNSAAGWAAALNKPVAQWGQMRDDAGKVAESQAALLAAQNEANQAVIKDFADKKGDPAALWQSIRDQIYVMQGQGFNEGEIMESIRATLTAAGLAKDHIEKILGDLKINFDFTNGKKDLDAFAGDTRKKLDDIFKPGAQGSHSLVNEYLGWGSLSDNTQWGGAQLESIGKNITDRLTTMDPAAKAAYAAKIAQEWGEAVAEGFKQLEEKVGADLGPDLWAALDKYTEMDGNRYRVKQEFAFGDGPDINRRELEELAQLGNAQRQFIEQIASSTKIPPEAVKDVKDLNTLFKQMGIEAISTEQAVKGYEQALKDAEAGGKKLTQEEKDKLAAVYASAAGLDAAKLAQGGYSLATVDASNATKEQIDEHNRLIDSLASLKDNLENVASGNYGADLFSGTDWGALGENAEAQAQALMDSTKQAMSGAQNDMLQEANRLFDEAFEQRMEGIANSYEAKREGLQKQQKDLDKSWDARMDAFKSRWDDTMDNFKDRWDQTMKGFKDRWDKTMDDTKKSFENRRKAIEDQAKREIEAIDAQIKAIEDRKEAESKAEEERQRIFENEERRIQRMNELRQGGIDYNRAMAEGNLDEAARVQGNMATSVQSWAIEDQQAASNLASQGRMEGYDNQIEGLQGKKDSITDRKERLLEALKEEEEATMESLEKRRQMEQENLEKRRQQEQDFLEKKREMQQRSLEAERENERQRLQARIDGLQKEQRAKEDAERKKNEAAKRAMENELATLRAYIPRNEAELNAHKNKISEVYRKYGVDLQKQGGDWGQFVGDALRRNVDVARAQMANANDWKNFGRITADAITQGAFGMSIGEFWNTIITGKLPERWQPKDDPLAAGRNRPWTGVRHKGGMIDSSPGSRAGITGGLKPGERPILAQDGEFMVQRSAVAKYGLGTLQDLNSGKIGIGGPSDQIGHMGLGMAMGAALVKTMMQIALLGRNDEELGVGAMFAGGKPGTYGGINLNAEQIQNASIIAGVGKELGASTRDIVIALMVAMQESTLRNINYGDRDSLGLFQQRAPWGSAAERTNPQMSARLFFTGGRAAGTPGLLALRGRETMPLTVAAQRVQRSAFPDAYAKWEAMATQLTTGGGLGAMSVGQGPGVLGRMFMQVAGGGGPGIQGALAWARSQHGKPYQWGGGGNPSWDCSGFMAAIANVIMGKSPNGHPFSTHSFQPGMVHPFGWIPGLGPPNGFSIGVTPGHMAGTLAGHNVESAGSGAGVRVDGPVGATHPMFKWYFHWPHSGPIPGKGGVINPATLMKDVPVNAFADNKPTSSADFKGEAFVKPAEGPTLSKFGARDNPTEKGKEFHTGSDIGAKSGSSTRSIARGVITKVGRDENGLGNFVTIMHPGGLYSTYGHLQGVSMREGQPVMPGQVFGTVGSTGRSTGPHLHLQLTNSAGQTLDPGAFIPSLNVGGKIKFDNTLANLHAGENVLTKPLSTKLEDGINNLDSSGGTHYNTYNIEVNGSDLTATEIMDEINRRTLIERKRKGEIR